MGIWKLIFKKKPEVLCVECKHIKLTASEISKCINPKNNCNYNKKNVVTGKFLKPLWRDPNCEDCRCYEEYGQNCGPKGKWFEPK